MKKIQRSKSKDAYRIEDWIISKINPYYLGLNKGKCVYSIDIKFYSTLQFRLRAKIF